MYSRGSASDLSSGQPTRSCRSSLAVPGISLSFESTFAPYCFFGASGFGFSTSSPYVIVDSLLNCL